MFSIFSDSAMLAVAVAPQSDSIQCVLNSHSAYSMH